MKIAHAVENGLGGMSAAARLEALWERKLGHDARLVFHKDRGYGNRDGVPVADFEFVRQCDVIVSHSTLGMHEQDLGIPFVLMCHGTPEHCYWSQNTAEGNFPYTALSNLGAHRNCAFIVTHWKRHIPFWAQIMPEERIRYVPPGVDLEAFTPGPADMSVFGGMGGKINVLSASRWRIANSPFRMINAFGVFAKRNYGARLHIVGMTNFVGLSDILDHMGHRGTIGMIGTNTSELPRLYRACDFSITGQWDAGLTPRESLACGCQVVGSSGLGCTPYTADVFDLNACADQMDLAYRDLNEDGRELTTAKNRQRAVDNFNPKVAAERMIALMQSIRPTGADRAWASPDSLVAYSSNKEARDVTNKALEEA